MKMSDVVYGCKSCGKEVTVPVGKPAPACCGLPMEPEPLPFCTSAPDPEMARNYDADEPCDDGTLPKKK
jgi:hypothetical protein